MSGTEVVLLQHREAASLNPAAEKDCQDTSLRSRSADCRLFLSRLQVTIGPLHPVSCPRPLARYPTHVTRDTWQQRHGDQGSNETNGWWLGLTIIWPSHHFDSRTPAQYQSNRRELLEWNKCNFVCSLRAVKLIPNTFSGLFPAQFHDWKIILEK